jgi:transcription antitermination factor NusG
MNKDDSIPYYWYAIYVKSKHEFKIIEKLKKVNIECFLPAIENLRKWKDRKKLVTFPLFPGYIFVHIRRNREDIMKVLETSDVLRFVGISSYNPEIIPDEQIYSLKKLIESKEKIDPYPYIKEGQRIKITKGPLAGAKGILIKKGDNHILVVSLSILKRSVSVKIDASDIEPI